MSAIFFSWSVPLFWCIFFTCLSIIFLSFVLMLSFAASQPPLQVPFPPTILQAWCPGLSSCSSCICTWHFLSQFIQSVGFQYKLCADKPQMCVPSPDIYPEPQLCPDVHILNIHSVLSRLLKPNTHKTTKRTPEFPFFAPHGPQICFAYSRPCLINSGLYP